LKGFKYIYKTSGIVHSTGKRMYKNTLFAILVAVFLLGSQATSAVEESTFAVGDKWAFGKEIDLMAEAEPTISELEGNITELMSSEEAEMVKNASGLELKSFELDNKAILGFYYTGEVIDDFDQMIHMQTEQSLYSHTVFGTKFTSMFPKEGEHELRMNVKCEEEMSEEEECEDPEIKILDNVTGEPLVLEELNTEIGGSMHYVAKITQDTWWTQDTHELAKTEITVSLAAAGGITIRNVPNITHDGISILNGDEGEETEFECDNGYETYPFDYANDGWEDCDDGSDEPGNGYDFECDNGDTYPMDYVNDGIWHCEDGEDEGESEEGSDGELFQDCEGEDEHEANCYETLDIKLETAVFEMSSDASWHLLFDFGDDPLNVLDLPLEENKYWDGDMSRLTISGDVGGKVDIKKPELSICPDSDCDQLPEMEELYSGLTDVIQELHDNETFSITVDRNNDGLPDVITGWNDIFPMYIPETWMDQIFQEILEEIACEEDDVDCDETAEEEFKRLNLRIENNRFAFGPYSVHEIEDFSPIPYAFETGEKETATASDGTEYSGYQVFPTDQCSENNPKRDDEDCDREDNGDDGGDGGIIPGSRSSHDGYHEDDCEGDPFCDSEIIWFHNADTGHPAYINMDMPNLKEDGYVVEMMPIESAVAEEQVKANADTDNPQKTTLIEFDEEKIEEESALPGFGVIAAGGSLLFIGRRFRK
jgi:hypothetical protein